VAAGKPDPAPMRPVSFNDRRGFRRRQPGNSDDRGDQTELVAVLAAALTVLAVQSFPDNPDYYRLTHPSGRGWSVRRRPVRRPGVLAARHSPSTSNTSSSSVKVLRTHVGAYAVLSASAGRVQPQDIKGAGSTRCGSASRHLLGVWTYTASMR
jgi:hypothetical protein